MTFPIPAPDPGDELAASVDEVFLGWWPDDLMDIVRAPYTKRALLGYAHIDGGKYLPPGDSDD